ncbi:hypothetical protein LCGC14_0467740 [marine sediment metagenome]|uniref:Uncharacterized protein n=1 Tax=marine sediment metagenome TaxID=412755 RepID=A0A0F9SII3_9ZZZZ|nr:sulfotransferase family protein [Phycisphaerae bacterium]HDZ43508.1 sulfotransferase family protein [Phycisphaerae bacterium]
MARRRKSSGGRRRRSASAKSPAGSDTELFQQALKSHRNGNHARAEALCQRILKRQPNHADSLHLLGIIAGLNGRDEEAAALIAQAVERDEANPACHSNLAVILKDLGLFYGQYERLMAHWRNVLPLDILEVPYEDLVDDQEGLSRKIVDFCGLPWDQRCLEFHRNTRQVKTSSAVQVRKPIYKTSVARWRNFQRHLGPFVGQLSADAD